MQALFRLSLLSPREPKPLISHFVTASPRGEADEGGDSLRVGRCRATQNDRAFPGDSSLTFGRTSKNRKFTKARKDKQSACSLMGKTQAFCWFAPHHRRAELPHEGKPTAERTFWEKSKLSGFFFQNGVFRLTRFGFYVILKASSDITEYLPI